MHITVPKRSVVNTVVHAGGLRIDLQLLRIKIFTVDKLTFMIQHILTVCYKIHNYENYNEFELK